MSKIAEKRGLKTPDAAVGIVLLLEEIAAMSNLPLLAHAMIGRRDSADAVLTAEPKSPRGEWLNTGRCTRSKRTYKHEKPPPDLAPLPRKPGAPRRTLTLNGG